MNICILLGKIVSEIEFKFIINSKNKSIAYFDLELLNKSRVRGKGVNTHPLFQVHAFAKN